MKFIVLVLLALFPLSSSFDIGGKVAGLWGKATNSLTGGPAFLTIRGQLFCDGKAIGGRVTLLEKDLVLEDMMDEVDVLILKSDKRLSTPSLAETCGPISQFYLHGEESEFDGAEWKLKIQPKCDQNPLCDKDFIVDWGQRSMKGRNYFQLKTIDVCSEEHRKKATEQPLDYVAFSSGMNDDWDKERK